MNTKEYSILPEITGVIHVGANVGQEMQAYSDYGLSVVWVEPLPSIFKLLQENLQGQNCTIKQKAYRYLVTDEDDKVTVIHATNNWGLSSSILELKLHKEMEPNIFVHHDVSMKSITLPTLIERENIAKDRYKEFWNDEIEAEFQRLFPTDVLSKLGYS